MNPTRTLHALTTLAALAAALSVSTAHANIVTVTGTLANTDPVFNRPIEDLSALSTVGTAVRYDVLEFVVSAAGDYTFLTTTGGFDPFAILYAPAFTAATPLVNALAANDDLLGQTTSGFSATLSANTVYRYVTTAFANTDLGAYSNTIGGFGTVSVVPEASSYAMMALGLAMLGIARRRSKALSV